MMKGCRIVLVAFAALALASGASAQMWRGQGHVSGKVTDEAGNPIAAVTVKAYLPSADGGTAVKTNKKGEWSIGGVASGVWQLDFTKDGYEPRRISVRLQELSRIPPVEIVLTKAAPDPNAIIADQMKQATDLMGKQKYAEAVAIYQDLLAKYPQAYQLYLSLARAYHAEQKFDEEIASLKAFLAKEPDNVQVALLAGSEMIAVGDADEGKALLSSIDESKIEDPAVFLNVGINLLNQNKPDDAMTFFEKTISRFPDYPEGYCYRGITNLQMGTKLAGSDQASDKAEGQKKIDAAKADLSKFVEMAPDAPEAPAAKKMLEQLK